MKRILIVKTSALGDVTLALGILPHLKTLAPDAKIDWACEATIAPLVRRHPLIHRVIEVDTKRWRRSFLSHRKEIKKSLLELRNERYDLIFDLQGNIKSGIITLLSKGQLKVGFGKKRIAEWPSLLATHRRFNPKPISALSDLLAIVYASFGKERPKTPPKAPALSFELDPAEKALIESLNSENALIVCPQSIWANKRFKRKTLSQFLRLIAEHYSCRFLISWKTPIEQINGEKTAKEIGSAAALLPELSAPALSAVMGRSLGVISVDSFPLHLAGLSGVPTFSVFGPSLGTYYKPAGPQHAHFQGTCPYDIAFDKRCPILRSCQTGSCMKQIDAMELFSAFKQSRLGLDMSNGHGLQRLSKISHAQ